MYIGKYAKECSMEMGKEGGGGKDGRVFEGERSEIWRDSDVLKKRKSFRLII